MTFKSQTVTVVTEQLLTFGNDSSRGEVKAEIPLQRWPVVGHDLSSCQVTLERQSVSSDAFGIHA